MKTTLSPNLIMTLHRENLTEVLEIENANSQEANPLSGRWTKKDFKSVMQTPNHEGLVVWRQNKIVAFAVYCIEGDKIHICNMAVHPNFLQQKIGTEIINRFKFLLQSKRKQAIEIDLRETNLRGQLFLRANKFRAIGVIRDWYEGPRCEDAYKFQFVRQDDYSNG